MSLIKFSFTMFWLVLALGFKSQIYGVSDYWNQYSLRNAPNRSVSARNRCPSLSGKLKNGWVKLKGQTASFKCFQPFILIGPSNLTCHHSGWNGQVPVCAAVGCRNLGTPSNGHLITLQTGLYVKFFCDPGYILNNINNTYLYCNGNYWNSTEPKCIADPSPKPLICDFESFNYCGWTPSDLDRVRITKFYFESFSYSHGDGSHFLHTFTPSNSESSLILYSPIFEARNSDTCFSFWYKILDPGFSLNQAEQPFKIYIKSEKNLIDDTLPWLMKINSSSTIDWVRGKIFVPPLYDSFQIVIDLNNVANLIGIDDIGISDREDCVDQVTLSSESSHDNWISCQKKCNQTLIFCSCQDTCEMLDNCCPDYQFSCQSSGNNKDDLNKNDIKIQTTTKATSLNFTKNNGGHFTSNESSEASATTKLFTNFLKFNLTTFNKKWIMNNKNFNSTTSSSIYTSFASSTTPVCNTKPSRTSNWHNSDESVKINASSNEDRKESISNEMKKKGTVEVTSIKRKNESWSSENSHSLNISTLKRISYDNKDNNSTTGNKLSQKLSYNGQKFLAKSGIFLSVIVLLAIVGLVFIFIKRRNRFSSFLYQDSELRYLNQDDDED